MIDNDSKVLLAVEEFHSDTRLHVNSLKLSIESAKNKVYRTDSNGERFVKDLDALYKAMENLNHTMGCIEVSVNSKKDFAIFPEVQP